MVKAFLSWLPTGKLCAVVVILALVQNPLAAGQLETIELEITTHLGDQQTFIEGDVISFLLSLDRDAYVYLIYQDASANIFEIFPNQKSGNHFYQKGLFMPVPPPQKDVQFKVQAPFGEEELFVFATDNAEVKLNARLLVNGLSLVESTIDEIETSIRRQSVSQFGSASLTIKSQSRQALE